MNGYQLLTAAFAIGAVSVSAFAIFSIVKSTELSRKPLWIIGSLFGFVGLGLNWTHPNDVLLVFGIIIPPVMIFTVLPAGSVIIKTGFPIVAAVALWKMRTTGYIDRR